MKSKPIISGILIYCILIQTLITNIGCTSFYPAEGINNLAHFKDYENNILLKLSDNSYLAITPKRFFFVNQPANLVYGTGSVYDYKTKKISGFTGFIEKKVIDSSLVVKVLDEAIHVYWTKDSKKYAFENKDVITITPDSGKYFWIVRDDFTGKFRKINNSDIQEIQLQKTNWVRTSLLITAAAGLVAVILVAAAISAIGNAFSELGNPY